ncbi:peptide/nickel transport system ATP-binding protein [Tamaricihabitans halophyticus]|uniref:Peptide/nickel transport system ATP-binding protein n=1 Tax=Tamaricihabitans halophyticus TaxID=1262583 RepID=A0A4R2QDH9_9PSEU|nr:ABC transporter ATP-binding protein [Tamaricihabitans halophyticus]TCP45051.1 peptide/nickel transport system ATP-binding protein [Tamaricihabitans halophyticus]
MITRAGGNHENGYALRIDDLSVSAATAGGVVDVVSGVSFDLRPCEITALAGESGSGKTVTALAVLRLHDVRTLRIRTGRILVDGADMASAGPDVLRRIRGEKVSMVFQEPMNSIDPMYTVGSAIVEVIRAHQRVTRRAALRQAGELLEHVGVPDPRNRLGAYPFELSGGLLQRVMIAMAIANQPSVLIADEPTTALDVTVQQQIMQLLRRLADEGMSILLVTHDLAVVSEYADTINVMYAGQIVESGPVREVLSEPEHPYTAGLVGAVPDVANRRLELSTIPGRVPPPDEFPAGCRFAPRCSFAEAECDAPVAQLFPREERRVRCVRHAQLSLEGVEPYA